MGERLGPVNPPRPLGMKRVARPRSLGTQGAMVRRSGENTTLQQRLNLACSPPFSTSPTFTMFPLSRFGSLQMFVANHSLTACCMPDQSQCTLNPFSVQFVHNYTLYTRLWARDGRRGRRRPMGAMERPGGL